MILPSLDTLIIFNKPNRSRNHKDSIVPNIAPKGIDDMRSIKNLPFK